MARPRTPTAILTQKGAFDHDPARARARENEPIPDGPLGAPPAYLDPDQVEAWHELAAEIPAGVLTNSDRAVLVLASRLWARVRANGDLKASEQTLLLSLLARMGMTPSDRSRISAPSPQREKAADTFSRLAATPRGREELKQ